MFHAADAKDLIGRSLFDLVHPEDVETVRQRVQMVEGPEYKDFLPHAELRFLTVDGHTIDVDATAAQVIVDGEATVLSAVRDITQRKAVDKKLHENLKVLATLTEISRELAGEEDLRELLDAILAHALSLLNASSSFIYLWDADQQELESWSRLGTRIPAGVRIKLADGLAGQVAAVREPLIVNDYRNWPHALPEFIAMGISAVAQVPLLYRGELVGVLGVHEIGATQRRFHEADTALLTLLAGQVAGIIVDKRAREALRNLNSELMASVRELESFSYSVSHDLRSPLRTIDGFARILQEDFAATLGAAGRADLARIREASHRMAQLISDLLDLARVRRKQLHRDHIDLSELAQQLCTEIQEQQPARRVEWNIAPDLAADGDPGLLKLALDNLLRNAWKFTGRVEHTRIEFGRREVNRQSVFFVRDNGAGFDPQYADKLFQPFERLHSPEEFEGTGVGLAIVQRIINRHGGRVWAEGAPGQGATFFFTLA